ncbi:MAG: anthranilate phosphoribosyltransferase [Clostridia bacterium]|nr:anthranilate phosphoribosyltransferase [Clostridia bacterium]
MIEAYLKKVVAGEDLNELEAEAAITAAMAGQATPLHVAALLTALRVKGEAVSEVVGAARAMRRAATRIRTRHALVADTCGTGGDGKGTINVSTAAAFVVAALGLPVAKHGNRAVSSRAGSADVLEALGAAVELPPEAVGRSLDELGLGFLYAPALHPAMRNAMPVRRALGFRTIFNILGPLTNPAGAQVQVVGVYEPRLGPIVAEALNALGTERALVVHGEDGMDELTLTGPSLVWEADGARVREFRVTPEEFGLSRAPASALLGGDARENAGRIRAVFDGRERGPARDLVLLNAGAALYAGGLAEGVGEGVRKAALAIDEGRAKDLLERFVSFTQAEAGAVPA